MGFFSADESLKIAAWFNRNQNNTSLEIHFF